MKPSLLSESNLISLNISFSNPIRTKHSIVPTPHPNSISCTIPPILSTASQECSLFFQHKTARFARHSLMESRKLTALLLFCRRRYSLFYVCPICFSNYSNHFQRLPTYIPCQRSRLLCSFRASTRIRRPRQPT